jgi:hypothetical protein
MIGETRISGSSRILACATSGARVAATEPPSNFFPTAKCTLRAVSRVCRNVIRTPVLKERAALLGALDQKPWRFYAIRVGNAFALQGMPPPVAPRVSVVPLTRQRPVVPEIDGAW